MVTFVRIPPAPATAIFKDSAEYRQAIIVGEVNGTWRVIADVPGNALPRRATLPSSTSVACPPIGRCAVGGTFGNSGEQQAFVAGS